MPFAISFLVASRHLMVFCVIGNCWVILSSPHSGYANNYWALVGNSLITVLAYFGTSSHRSAFIQNLDLHIYQNLSLQTQVTEHAEQMRAYQKVVAATAHDLRTASAALLSGCSVLTTLSNFAQARGEERKKELSIIVDMSAMAKFCSQFLEGMTLSARLLDGGSSSVPISIERIDVRQLLEESIGCAKLACSSSNSVEHGSSIPEGLQHIYSDMLCLSRNLLNLLSNASKHTRAGSITVHVSLHHHPTDPDNPENSENSDNRVYIEFSVRDTGTGVKDGVQKTIFEPFVSLDGSTGLGLFVIQMQSAALGGSCGVRENPVSTGSEFWFRIPYLTSIEKANEFNERTGERANYDLIQTPYGLDPGAKKVFVEDVSDERKEVELPASSISNDCLTILLIDDTSSLLTVVCEELTNAGYSVTRGLGAQEGLELMKTRIYSLVLVDIKMPYQNGDEIVAGFRHWEKFNRVGEQVQLIYALTSYTNDEVQRRCKEARMSGIIRKPLQIEKIEALLRDSTGGSTPPVERHLGRR